MPAKIAVIALWAEDLVASSRFYRDVLRLSLLPDHVTRLHFDVEGVHLTILRRYPAPAQDAEPDDFPLFAVAVHDLDKRVSLLKKHRVALTWGIEGNETPRLAKFHNPGGNLIGLVQFNA
jgi:catechol-2,3-dioxygenase